MKPTDADTKKLWRKVYEFVATLHTEEFEMMNYGYAGEEKVDPDAAGHDERFAQQMYEHVMGRADLRGKDVLEIGCGRGGGAALAKERFAPARVCGLDFSHNAIDICRRRYREIEGLEFRCGDAEDLPFAAGEFDAVANIESSYCYASRPAFYRETWRVLKDGGDFLYADFFTSPVKCVEQLEGVGFRLVAEADITGEVLRSLDQDHCRKEKLLRDIPQPKRSHLENWAGLIGSRMYEAFQSRYYTYRSYHLRKPASS